VLALVEALDVELEPLDIVKLGVLAARRAGVTVTGAFDDACASFFGGLVFTDNENDVLLKRVEINATVLVYIREAKRFQRRRTSREQDCSHRGSIRRIIWLSMANMRRLWC